jgi:hypothetical protein
MPRQTSPDLSLPLAEPITLTRGPRSHLVTLMDAAILIRELEPFRQARPVWDRAAENNPDRRHNQEADGRRAGGGSASVRRA